MTSERDIFNYVFFKEKMNKDLISSIENENNYKDLINFYKTLKSEMEEDLNINVKHKLADKIDTYSLEENVILYPIEYNSHKKNNSPVLTAASAKEKENIEAKSFMDEKKKYLIRALKMDSKIKIYVFSTSNELLSNFKLLFNPMTKEFMMKDNSQPLILDFVEIPQSIEIIF